MLWLIQLKLLYDRVGGLIGVVTAEKNGLMSFKDMKSILEGYFQHGRILLPCWLHRRFIR